MGHDGAGRGGFQPPRLTLFLGAVMAAAYLLLGPAPAGLMLDRQAVANGEIWRLLTGHLVHADDAHLSWNLGAFLVLSGLYELQERPGPGRYFGLLAAAALAVDAWFWWLQPGLLVYCGLSGVLNGFFAVLTVFLWRRTRHPAIALAGLAAVAKIAVEAGLGASLLPTTAWTAVPGAQSPSVVLDRVSAETSAANQAPLSAPGSPPGPVSTTVRQAPEHAIEAPSARVAVS